MQFYATFFGRGIMQLTRADLYELYGVHRQFPNLPLTHVYVDSRITQTSTHFFGDPRDRAGAVVRAPRVWAPRFDPDVVATDDFSANDSEGFFWVLKNTGCRLLNINRQAFHATRRETT